MVYHTENNHKVFMLDKVNFETRKITMEKGRYFIGMKESTH